LKESRFTQSRIFERLSEIIGEHRALTRDAQIKTSGPNKVTDILLRSAQICRKILLILLK